MNGELKKSLNLLDVFCIASGAMISSGLFILPGIAHAAAGSSVVLSYFIAGLLAMTGMLSQAELASAMPKAGGTYFYVTRTMGPAVGTVDGFITWISLCLKASFALVGMAAFVSLVVTLDIHIIGLILCALFLVVNVVGIKEAGMLQVFLVLGLFIILIIYVSFGVQYIKINNIENFMPNGVGAIFSTAGMVFVSYGGLLKVASIAEEVKNPARTIPLGMIFSLLCVTILYVLVVFVTTGVLNDNILNNSLTPISDGANVFLGTPGKIFLGIAAILAFVSTANAGIMASSRYPFAMGRDMLLPKIFMSTHKKLKTPVVALTLSAVFIGTSLFLKLEVLVKAASAVLFITFIFSCLCVIVLRESKLQNYRPHFKSPLYPYIQIIGIIGSIVLIFKMGFAAITASMVLVVLGLFIYFFYGRIRTDREYALLHLIERITDKELTSRNLEVELKEIIRERDEIVMDRFDKLIDNSLVLDLDESMNINVFFEYVSDKISKEININKTEIYNKLLKREGESSTAISPTLAIPHIVIDGDHKFMIVLVRCKKGIHFSEQAPSVKTVFILLGTIDERNFHLRALSAIAQVVQSPDFEKLWNTSKGIEDLKDSVLLSNRKR